MARSVNEMNLRELQALTRYVDAIARRDVLVQLGIVEVEEARQRLVAEFDGRLREASRANATRDETFRLALLHL